MNRVRVLIAVVGLSLAALLVAQQTSTSSSTSKSGGGQSSASSSSSGSSRSGGSHSAGGSGSGNGGGSASGFQGKPTHAIFFNQSDNANSDAVTDKAFQQEAKYMADQQAKGKVMLFGPWRDQPGSMALVLAQNDSEAEQIAKNDPAVRSGNLTYEVRAWNVR